MTRFDQLFLLPVLLVTLVIASGCGSRPMPRDPIHQYSSPDIVQKLGSPEGLRPGNITELGNFGFGILSDTSGLYVRTENKAFLVDRGGTVAPFRYGTKLSYGLLTRFDTDAHFETLQTRPRSEFTEYLTGRIKSKNLFFAFKIRGHFESIQLNSGLQDDEPDRTYRDLTGLLVGFYLPEKIRSLGQRGYRFVFLNRTLNHGGIARSFVLEEATIAVDHSHDYTLSLPQTRKFYDLELP